MSGLNMGQDKTVTSKLIYGKQFWGKAVPLIEIDDEITSIVVEGKVFNCESRDIRNNTTLIMFGITDYTDSIKVKMFVETKQALGLKKSVKNGGFLRIKGNVVMDSFDNELCLQRIVGIEEIPNGNNIRKDNATKKRVELHCHTKMSDMDGVSEVSDIIKTAYSWGHPAIAITDHGVVQAFPAAYHTWQDLWKKEKARREEAGEENPDCNDFFKVIYGVEAYIVNDLAKVVTNPKGQELGSSFVVFDIETTGFSPVRNKITEIGAVKVKDGQVIDRFSTFVNPREPIPGNIVKLTNITDEMVKDAPPIEEVLPKFAHFVDGSILVAHNASFDTAFIFEFASRLGLVFDDTYVDTLELSRDLLPHLPRYKLDVVCNDLGVSLEGHHRAVNDAKATAECFIKLIDMAKVKGAKKLDDLNNLESEDDYEEALVRRVKKTHSYHAIILAKNDIGRVNLYKLVSKSHLKFVFRGRPIIPKSYINEYREGLILGSACEAGELYQAILEDRPEAEIADIVSFYDYLEIQPLSNDMYMISSEKIETVNSVEDLQNINKRIVELGERYNKPVAATGDVHFLNPEDEVYRRIIKASMGFEDFDYPDPLYFRTTEEMLVEFAYLGSDKAYEVVVTNTNHIADMISNISPVRSDKCPPVIENSDEILKELCYKKAHELYGKELPEIVENRLKTELDSVIGNGYSVLYLIGQKLVEKSLQKGYLVGSRGSVGSSFAAYVSGITEVNPLPPHYLCPHCHYSDFESEEVVKHRGGAGYDMPRRNCPICGTPLNKEGFDIPFEIFLGFDGDKEPDIDLNFSGDIQSTIHKYTEEIFGKENCYKAGTIGTIAERSAYGYVKKYMEEKGINKRRAEIERLASGCIGVKRGTGQHPGGIIVLPKGEDINSFTPIQYPANDSESSFITTHFDYHSIDHNLLKFDLLGHDDPTMLRFLKDCTGVDPKEVPFDDPKVMELFKSTDILGITPNQIGGTKVGCLGLPEFGTDFAMSMVIDAKPESFSDLVRLSGLAHGTDVWLGNAKDLIDSGIATLQSCICCRDDIMAYLIEKGIDKHMSFDIMESVRKGKGLSEQMESVIKKSDIPQWYVDSCKKIKYMFPKAHAAAYVMMVWRIAYYKIYYPQAFYAAWFTVRANTLDYENMFCGLDKVEECLSVYREKGYLKQSEKDEYTALRVAEEMYARGIEIEPIELNIAEPSSFIVYGDRIMPSLTSVVGLGEKAAEQIINEAQEEPFSSIDEFKLRTKCPQMAVDNMLRLGLLDGIPNPIQLTLFDFME